jgi:hypothetical protein
MMRNTTLVRKTPPRPQNTAGTPPNALVALPGKDYSGNDFEASSIRGQTLTELYAPKKKWTMLRRVS